MTKKVDGGILETPRMAFGLLIALIALLALAPPAFATHLPPVAAAAPEGVSLDSGGTRIVYKARPNEHNILSVSETDTEYVFEESGGGVLPVASTAPGCTVAALVTTCSKAGIESIAVLTGDEDITGQESFAQDTLNVTAAPPRGTWLDGGSGNDDITSGSASDDIFGRAGIDNINSGTGNDFVTPGPSAEDPAGERFAQISVGGQSGFDEIRLDDRVGPVTLTPTFAQDSDATNCPTVGSCFDDLSSFERLVAGPGDDELIGNSSNQVLVGLEGADVMCGGWGTDTVDYSEPGRTQGVTVDLAGTIESDPRHIAPAFNPGLLELRKKRPDCREVDPLRPPSPRTVPGRPPGNPHGGVLRDCTPNDGAPGEQDCVGDDVENIIGTDFNDVLTGNDPDVFEGLGPTVEPHGVNDIKGRGGDDVIDGGLGNDALSGGAGNDTVTYAGRTQPLNVAIDGAGNDGAKSPEPACVSSILARANTVLQPPWNSTTVVGFINANKDIYCSDYDNRTRLSDAIADDVETIIGGSADDRLAGNNSANLLQGGEGADYIDGNGGDDRLEGGAKDDTILGGDGADTILGGDGNDTVEGENDGDNVQGEAGNDFAVGGAGGDLLRGGDGSDVVDYSEASTSISVTADGAASDDGRSGEGDNVGGDFETIIGGLDNDAIAGGPGSEQIFGQEGDDLLSGGGGADDMSGGPGEDVASYGAAGGPVHVNLAEPGNDGEAGEGDYVREDVERVHGGPADDTLLGDAKPNVLLGRDGNDRIAGAEGDDQLVGGPGNDNLSGDVGNDTLFGGDDNDTLAGADGNDDLKGEAGDDNLDGGAGADRHFGGPNLDAISYSSRTAGVSVTLDGKDKNGQTNENDFIGNDIENVRTGSGGDTIDSDDNKPSDVRCGGGADVVTADPDDRINADCESVQVSALGTRCSASSGRVNMAKGVVPVRVFCAVSAKGTIRLQSVSPVRTSKGKARRVLKLGSKSFNLKAGQRKAIRVKVSKAAARYIKRKKRLSVRARITAKQTGKKASLKSSSVFTVRGK